jgi:hypothetical protein
MNEKLYFTILNAIPLYANETYLERADRELIASSIYQRLKDDCEHNWINVGEVKIIDAKICSKCGDSKCKHN